jgi:nicotinate phosphoribosyltransferase
LSICLWSLVQGGFDASSNVLAGRLFGIPVRGTHAHAFVQSYSSLDDVRRSRQSITHGASRSLSISASQFIGAVLGIKNTLACSKGFARSYSRCVDGELAAFSSFAMTYPTGFLALVDTYDTLESGVLNFMLVALVLIKLGYQPVGIRLDSGDLAELSRSAREIMSSVAADYCSVVETSYGEDVQTKIDKVIIMASNDLNEQRLIDLERSGHKIDWFGIGTALATCSAQPALGCVYKLVELDGEPRMKKSEDRTKATIPGGKNAYRLYLADKGCGADVASLDFMSLMSESAPVAGQKLCYLDLVEAGSTTAPFRQITPSRVECLLEQMWDCEEGAGRNGATIGTPAYLNLARSRAQLDLQSVVLARGNPSTPLRIGISRELAAARERCLCDIAS